MEGKEEQTEDVKLREQRKTRPEAGDNHRTKAFRTDPQPQRAEEQEMDSSAFAAFIYQLQASCCYMAKFPCHTVNNALFANLE